MTDQAAAPAPVPAKITTSDQKVAADIVALLRARNPLLWVVTREEARVEKYLFEAAAAAKYLLRTWDCDQGVCEVNGQKSNNIGSKDVEATLQAIGERAQRAGERCVWVMRDLGEWLTGPIGIGPRRQLRNLARKLPGIANDRAQAIIVTSTSAEVPVELSAHATVIEWPLPDRAEIGALLDAAIETLPEVDSAGKQLRAQAAPNGVRNEAIDAAIGLTGEEAQATFAKSIVQLRRIDPIAVAREKKRVITRERVLEWYDPLPGGLDAVGGLDALKGWLQQRRLAYTPRARAYNLPTPKGVLLVGVPGCGKSLSAKAVATNWGVPLLRIDLGGLKSKFVGESEANLRKAFRVIETVGRCVVWFDEIEKALAGATQGAADGGVSSDALGSILSWMQERQGEAFVVATANDIAGLPPELLRKGRFDELFFVDLPTVTERVAVLKAALASFGRKAVDIDHAAVADVCENFSGSEITAIVPDALFAAFADGEREIVTADLIEAAGKVVTLAETAKDRIAALREWAKGKARSASTEPLREAQMAGSRVLDL